MYDNHKYFSPEMSSRTDKRTFYVFYVSTNAQLHSDDGVYVKCDRYRNGKRFSDFKLQKFEQKEFVGYIKFMW